jgi:hypothetical protein
MKRGPTALLTELKRQPRQADSPSRVPACEYGLHQAAAGAQMSITAEIFRPTDASERKGRVLTSCQDVVDSESREDLRQMRN